MPTTTTNQRAAQLRKDEIEFFAKYPLGKKITIEGRPGTVSRHHLYQSGNSVMGFRTLHTMLTFTYADKAGVIHERSFRIKEIEALLKKPRSYPDSANDPA